MVLVLASALAGQTVVIPLGCDVQDPKFKVRFEVRLSPKRSGICNGPSNVEYWILWDDPEPWKPGNYRVSGCCGPWKNRWGSTTAKTEYLFGSQIPLCPPITQGINRFITAMTNVTVTKNGVTSAACTPQELHQLCLYVDCTDPADPRDVIGHVFLQLVPASGFHANDRDIIYGFYPKFDNLFKGGKLRGNGAHDWDYRICYPITTAQYEIVRAAIDDTRANPPDYHLLKYNCTDWALEVAGRVLPKASLPDGSFFTIDDPDLLCVALQAMSGFPSGGVVERNTAGKAANGGRVSKAFPMNVTISAVQRVLHASPAGAAGQMRLPLRSRSSASLAVGQSGVFRIAVAKARTSDSVVSVDWGDGSARRMQKASFSHTYSKQGTFKGSVAILDSEAVRHFPFTIVVGSGSASTTFDVKAPTPVPNTFFNPGGEIPEPVPPIGPLLKVRDAGGGQKTLDVYAIPRNTREGWTFVSLKLGSPEGQGPFFGIYPDGITSAIVGGNPTASIGNVFHWKWPAPSGSFPASPFTVPSSIPTGLKMDLVTVTVGPGGETVRSPVVRATF